jgi:hypothetical protein
LGFSPHDSPCTEHELSAGVLHVDGGTEERAELEEVVELLSIPLCVTGAKEYTNPPRTLQYRGTSLIRNCPPPRTAIGP